MSKEQVVALMESATSEADWNAKCNQVKKAFGGQYPDFWYETVVTSGLARTVAARFGASSEIHVSTIPSSPG